MGEPIDGDIEAEKALLGAVLLSGDRSILDLDTSDFLNDWHQVIATSVRGMLRRGIPIDMLTLADELEKIGKLSLIGPAGGRLYLHELMTSVPTGVNAPYYAAKVRDAARVAALYTAAHRARGMAMAESAIGDFDDIVRQLRKALDEIPVPLGNADRDDSRDTIGAILEETDEDTDWLIPGLLAREERVVIVAGEGVAKTTMLRQLAVCFAGGLHPWAWRRCSRGLRVLFIDAENSRAQSRRAYRWIAGRCWKPTIDPAWKSNIIHKTRNDGVNLTGRDESWFRDVADRVNPDVIILSPAYKLMRGDPKEDRDVQDLLDVIDRVRVQHRAAVVIETHAPHGQAHGRDMRPYGSSVWLRWPEIGIGWQRNSEVPAEYQQRRPEQLESVDWRGAREERAWPTHIRYGDPRSEPPWVNENGIDAYNPQVSLSYEIPDSEGRAA